MRIDFVRCASTFASGIIAPSHLSRMAFRGAVCQPVSENTYGIVNLIRPPIKWNTSHDGARRDLAWEVLGMCGVGSWGELDRDFDACFRYHTAGYEGIFNQFRAETPVPCPYEPPYVPTVLPIVGAMDYPLPGYSETCLVDSSISGTGDGRLVFGMDHWRREGSGVRSWELESRV